MSGQLTVVELIHRKAKAWDYKTLRDAMQALTILLGEYDKLKAENACLLSELKK